MHDFVAVLAQFDNVGVILNFASCCITLGLFVLVATGVVVDEELWLLKGLWLLEGRGWKVQALNI